MARNEQVFDTLRLHSKDIQRIVEDLERRASDGQAGMHRQSRRWTMRTQRVIVTVVGPMNQRSHVVVAPRNLSQGGMAFLSGNYIHIGSQCFITLRTLGGKGLVIPAVVRRCQHLENRLHDIGVEFAERIDPRNFMIDTNGQHLFNAERVDVRDLSGTVLVINGEPLEQRLLGHYFSESQIDVLFAPTAEQGMKMLDMTPDLVFVDVNLPDKSGFDFLASARGAGIMCPMILMTAEDEEIHRTRAFDEGANEVLTKPVPPELIHRAAAEYLIAAAEARKIVENSVAKIERAVGIGKQERTEYVQELREVADAIAEAFERGDTDMVRKKVLMIKSSAPGFGFPAVAQMAESVLSAIDHAKELSNSRLAMERFVRDVKLVNAA